LVEAATWPLTASEESKWVTSSAPISGRVALGVEEEDVALDPRDVGLFRAATVVASAQGGTGAVEESRFRRGDWGRLAYDERDPRAQRARRRQRVDRERKHDPNSLRSGAGRIADPSDPGNAEQPVAGR
jgi:hypothetical protein